MSITTKEKFQELNRISYVVANAISKEISSSLTEEMKNDDDVFAIVFTVIGVLAAEFIVRGGGNNAENIISLKNTVTKLITSDIDEIIKNHINRKTKKRNLNNEQDVTMG